MEDWLCQISFVIKYCRNNTCTIQRQLYIREGWQWINESENPTFFQFALFMGCFISYFFLAFIPWGRAFAAGEANAGSAMPGGGGGGGPAPGIGGGGGGPPPGGGGGGGGPPPGGGGGGGGGAPPGGGGGGGAPPGGGGGGGGAGAPPLFSTDDIWLPTPSFIWNKTQTIQH